jgi:amidase
MTDVLSLSAIDLARRIRDREVSPVEVTAASLRRAEALDERLGMFVTRTPDRAMAQARDAEAALMAVRDPADLPPLLGVPCPVKDLVAVAGVRLTLGSAAFADQVADVDDGVVTLLQRAGTVMTGKTNTPEIGLPCYTEPAVAPPRAPRGTRTARRGVRAGEPPSWSPPEWHPSRRARTAAGPSASRPVRAGSSG